MKTSLSDATVFIIDDDPAMKDSLFHLARSMGFSVETFSSPQEYLDTYDSDRRGCCLLNATESESAALDYQEWLVEHGVQVPMIIVIGHGYLTVELLDQVRDATDGAVSFLEKPFSDHDVLEAITLAMNCDDRQRRKEAETSKMKARIARLTPSERKVMDLIMDGKPNSAIAAELGLSPKTVEIHRARVMRKMQDLSDS